MCVLVLYSCSKDQVGTVSLGLFTTKDLKIEKLNDPLIPGVICYISNIIADFSFAYPLDSSIICRQTGEITLKVLSLIDKSISGDVLFTKSKSILFKSLKVRRIFDPSKKLCFTFLIALKKLRVALSIQCRPFHYGKHKPILYPLLVQNKYRLTLFYKF